LSLAAVEEVEIELVLVVLAVFLKEQQTLYRAPLIQQLLAAAEQLRFKVQILYLEV
jgi:hypothetical protein